MAEQHSGPIDLMITDVVMPYMDGHELARKITPIRPDLSILYISGYNHDMATNQSMADPESEFLQKPFSPMDVAKKIRSILDGTCNHRLG